MGTGNYSSTQRRALTLVELMAVLILLGLAATVTAVQLQGTTQQGRLRSATVGVEQMLRLAHHQAVRFHRPTWLQFERGSGRYRLNAQTSSQPGNWHILERVNIVEGGFRTPQAVEGAAAGQVQNHDTFTVRISPTGSSLPFALELQAGAARRLLWTDGITGQVRFRDGIHLGDFDWEESQVVPR